MSIRELVEAECGGANQLMRLGAQVTRDVTRKDDGFVGGSRIGFPSTSSSSANELVDEFLAHGGRAALPPPQTFQMEALLKEMQNIEPSPQQMHDNKWAGEFVAHQQNALFDELPGPSRLVASHPPGQSVWVQDFFNEPAIREPMAASQIPPAARELLSEMIDVPKMTTSEFMNFVSNVADETVTIDNGNLVKEPWVQEFHSGDNWVEDFEQHKQVQAEETENYNQQFWNRLQEEWKKISEESDEGHPWLSEFSNFYDPYKEYNFDEHNPAEQLENAFERGKQFLADGDVPSAVLCFEAAVKQSPDNAEYWEYLGTSQAENEKDPNAIAALKRSLDLNPNNSKVLMALAVSFTNESLQNQALKMLMLWLRNHPIYSSIADSYPTSVPESASMASSLIQGPELVEVQNLFLKAVQKMTPQIDADLQEALGVLFNLSSEYDKAVDCFQAAVSVCPTNAKAWNRLGASLANGNRSTEAVEAYQRALELEPGYTRTRYNVGIVCINLKAYREAVEHFLTALNHQANSINRSGLAPTASAGQQMSDPIWSTLRMSVSLMGRHDLQPAIDRKDLNALNKAFESGT